MSNFSKNEIKSVVDNNLEYFHDYLRLESVSTQGRDIEETAQYVAGMFKELGGEAKILDDLGGHPLVYGYFEAGPEGDSDKTLLFYNHYDVQPEDPLDEWSSAPFVPTLTEDGKLVARGVSDDKGELMARLYAIALYENTPGGLPVNIKFLVEGEEEIGSPTINQYIEKYSDLLEADAVFWEGGGKNENEEVVVYSGVKGIAYFELTVEGSDADIHSSNGAVFNNPAWRLVHALASMRDKNNQITIDGFYDLMEEPSEEEYKVANDSEFNGEVLRDVYGLELPFITEDLDYTPQEALNFYPTLTISGMEAGYTGEGTKTILPSKASAKLDFRLVEGYTPKAVEEMLRNHLDNHGFEEVEVELLTELMPYRSDLSDPFVQKVADAAHDVYGEGVVMTPSMSGGGPMYPFGKYLNAPIASTGIGYEDAKVHSPNENIRREDFYQGVEYLTVLFDKLG